MKKTEFDELQQSRRYQYGYQSFILLAMLIMIDNILYGMGIVWSQHPVNTFILLLVGCTYFISRCIWGDAFVGPKETPKRMAVKTAAVVLFAAAAAVIAAGYALIHLSDKQTSDNSGSLLFLYCLIMWAVIATVYIIKRVRGNKEES